MYKRGALSFIEQLDNKCFSLMEIHIFIHCCHMDLIFLNDYLVHIVGVCILGPRCLHTRGSWSAHELP
jgi:hypothetical protein